VECLTEFTCSVFVDGELPEDESRQAEEHLAACPSCRKLAGALREESRILVACIQEIDMTNSVPAAAPVQVEKVEKAARPVDIAKFGGLLVGLTTLIRLAMSSPENFALPSSPVNLDWLDPSKLSGGLSWLGGFIAFFAEQGVSGMASLVNSLSTVTTFVLLVAAVGILVRRSLAKGAFASMLAALGGIVLIMASMPSSSYAIDIKADQAEKNKVLLIPVDQVVDDSLFAAGGTVIIDGTINGDLIAFASRLVTVHGTVKGNIVSAAQNIEIVGTVEGSVIAAGSSVQVNGKVLRNVLGFGNSVSLGKDGNVGGDFGAFSSSTRVDGNVTRNFYGFGLADIAGIIGRNAVFHGSNLNVLSSARIGGNLTSYVQKAETVHVETGSVIGGKQSVELSKREPRRSSALGAIFSEGLHVAAAFVTGIVLLLLFPGVRRITFAEIPAILISGGVGFLGLVAMPIAAIILMVTLVGIPVALISFIAWFAGMYLAKILVANFIGRTLIARNGDRFSTAALGLIVGLLLVFIAINLPYIGPMIHFILVLIGFGGLIMSIYRSFKVEPAAALP
jgi:anti-sigma factor RsiW